MTHLSPVIWLSAVLLAVGGINWGLVGLFEYHLVAGIFGEEFGMTNTITRVVYTLVGASAFITLSGLAIAQMTTPVAGKGRGGQSQLTNN